MANGGTMRNRGVEVLVTVVTVNNKDFDWSTTGTFSLNSKKLISLSGSIFKSDYDYFNTGTVEYSGQVADSHRVQVGESLSLIHIWILRLSVNWLRSMACTSLCVPARMYVRNGKWAVCLGGC